MLPVGSPEKPTEWAWLGGHGRYSRLPAHETRGGGNMTHRNPDRRWLENPQRRVGEAQLNRVEEAANQSKQPSEPQQREPTRDERVTNPTPEQ